MNKEPETYDELIRQKRCIDFIKYYYVTKDDLEKIYQFLEKYPKGIVSANLNMITLKSGTKIIETIPSSLKTLSIDGINMSNSFFRIIPHVVYTSSSSNGWHSSGGSSYSGGSSNNNNNNNNNNTAVCGNYGEWTTEFKNDPSLEYETRVLIKAYKTEKIYGEYSAPTKTKPEEQAGIEIKSYETTETTSEYTDWTTTNEKPEDKTGREIKTSTENTPYSSKSCKNVTKTYTKKITGTDKKAIKCSAVKGEYMKYVCTYKKTVKKCSTTTKYKTTTTYTYRDLVEKQQQVTYYQTRTVTDNTVYTNYILESEIPSGYIKLNGSEITQYRYRQVCSK